MITLTLQRDRQNQDELRSLPGVTQPRGGGGGGAEQDLNLSSCVQNQTCSLHCHLSWARLHGGWGLVYLP